ncbi:MAG: hypothetical protein KAJ95_10300 [Gammaproteobacteria bacterium]|nr:hypothetical protein [Gammaproteobacteria bacterium]
MIDTKLNEGERKWHDFINKTYARLRSLPLPVVPENTDRSVVLMEPRLHPHLEYVLRNTLYFAGEGWGLEIFAGPENWDYLKKLTKDWGTVRFHDLQAENLSTIQYNSLKKNADTWKKISAEHICWVELDCLLCRPGIDEFIEWDYVGAPWRTKMAISPNCRVGNGGLSLRSRSAMLRIADETKVGHPIPNPSVIYTEDLYFCINMQLCNQVMPGTFKIPDVETAARFCVESVFSPSPLGLHKTWKYFFPHQIEEFLGKIQY